MTRSRSKLLLMALTLGFAVATSTVPSTAPSGATSPKDEPAANPWSAATEPKAAALLYDRWQTFTVADGLPSNKVTTVLVTGNDLWVGTDHGLARRRNGAWRSWGEADGLGHRYVTSLAFDPVRGELWAGTFGGLSRVSGDAITTFTQLDSGLMNDVVYDVDLDRDLVWAATAAGTSGFDLESRHWVLFDHQNSIMHEPWCYSVASGGGRLWIGVWGGGVVELDRKSGLWREYRDPDKEMEIDLLRDDGPIHDVTAFVAWDEGVLWQATYFGLSRFDGHRWRTYRRVDSGLPGDFINHVATRGRTAFLGTDQGFGVFDGETAVAYETQPDGTCVVTITRGGELVERRTLPAGPAGNYVLWTAPGDGDVWVATGSGLSRGLAGPLEPTSK